MALKHISKIGAGVAAAMLLAVSGAAAAQPIMETVCHIEPVTRLLYCRTTPARVPPMTGTEPAPFNKLMQNLVTGSQEPAFNKLLKDLENGPSAPVAR